MPESPRWLVQRDRQDEALKVLARIHADNDVSDPYVQAEFAEIKAKLSYEKLHPAPSYFDLLFGSQRRRMWIGIGVVSELPPQLCNCTDRVCEAILAIHDWYQRVCFATSFIFCSVIDVSPGSCTTPSSSSSKLA